jgi:hypothetical protein
MPNELTLARAILHALRMCLWQALGDDYGHHPCILPSLLAPS